MPTNITDVDAFTDPIQGPADADAQAAASYNLGFQGVANRTRNLANRLGGATGVGEWTYENAPRSGEIRIPMSAFIVQGAVASYSRLGADFTGATLTANGQGLVQKADDEIHAFMRLNRYFPHGSTITKVRAAVDYYTTGTDSRIEMKLSTYALDFSSWVGSGTGAETVDTNTVLDSVVLADGTGRKIMDSGAISVAMDVTANSRTLEFRLKGNNNRIAEVLIQFDDPGPRNR